jgi:cell wall-associated NlpC family hydrolase
MTSPNTPSASRPGTSTTGGSLGSTTSSATNTTALGNAPTPSSFPTLSPPQMGTLVYAPNVQILIAHNGIQQDVSKDIVRGLVSRKLDSASSLFFTLANPQLRYNSRFSRMDRITCYLTRTQKLQVFSGYIDKMPYFQAYPGTVDFRATCTLKRLLHTWWNPALPDSLQFFSNMGPGYGTAGDGQVSDTGMSSILRSILEQVGGWPDASVHIQNFPQEFITFMNNYMLANNVVAHNAAISQQFAATILGDDTAPGPMGATGYQSGDPVGTAATATNNNVQFYLSQIIAAVDQRGMGPIVNSTADAASLNQVANTLESAQSAGGITPSGQAMSTDVHTAGTQLGQAASNWSTQNQASDAAILALACAMVESGGGTPAIIMYANNSDPETLTYWHDGLSTNGSSSGLFQQQNNGAWGTASQRMNPLSSAGMFLDALNAKTGWRNMAPGQAIWQVQQSDPSTIAKYTAAVTEATTLVQAYRKTQQGATTQANAAVSLMPGAGALSSIGSSGANALASTAGSVIGAATNSPVSTASAALGAGRPVPDSEGAINAAMTLIGTPYVYGGTNPATGIDCSRMVELAFQAINCEVGRDTVAQKGKVPAVLPFSSAQRGDLIQTLGGGHTGIYLGAGMWIQTGGPTPMPGPQPISPSSFYWVGRWCSNGGLDPAAPFTPIPAAGSSVGGTPGTGTPADAGTGGAGGGGGGSGTGSEPIARDLFSYVFTPAAYASSTANFFTGEKAYIDDQPLIQIVRALCTASLRSFQSAPNGDFMAFYPDQFGLDGKPAVLALEDIELKDCHIDLSDDNMATHVYIEGDFTLMGQADQAEGWLNSSGTATVENAQLYQRLASFAPGDVDANMTAQQLLNRFGVRPYRDSYPLAGNAGLEFLLACQIFMGKWASQYETDIGLTFMPELYPGMRISLVGHNLQVYVSAVTHEFDWARGFSTTATVGAASKPQAASSLFASMPGFLNTISTNATGGGNTGFAGITPGGLLDGVGSFIGAAGQIIPTGI